MKRQFTSLYIDNILFGIDVLLVREINNQIKITNVDMTPDYVVGLINLRGQIVTVIDAGKKMNLKSTEINESSSCIILKTNHEINKELYVSDKENITSNDIVGLTISRVGDMVEVDDSSIEPAPANIASLDSRFLEGAIKLENELMLILDVGMVLQINKEIEAVG